MARDMVKGASAAARFDLWQDERCIEGAAARDEERKGPPVRAQQQTIRLCAAATSAAQAARRQATQEARAPVPIRARWSERGDTEIRQPPIEGRPISTVTIMDEEARSLAVPAAAFHDLLRYPFRGRMPRPVFFWSRC